MAAASPFSYSYLQWSSSPGFKGKALFPFNTLLCLGFFGFLRQGLTWERAPADLELTRDPTCHYLPCAGTKDVLAVFNTLYHFFLMVFHSKVWLWETLFPNKPHSWKICVSFLSQLTLFLYLIRTTLLTMNHLFWQYRLKLSPETTPKFLL